MYGIGHMLQGRSSAGIDSHSYDAPKQYIAREARCPATRQLCFDWNFLCFIAVGLEFNDELGFS